MLICDRCGETRREEDLEVVRYYDEVPGNSAMSGFVEETITDCSCGGEFEKAVECPICGDWVAKSEGFHEECYKKHCRDLETVVKYARGDLNILLTEYVFSEDEITEILLKAVREAYALPTDKRRIEDRLQAFTDGDKRYFAEWIGRGQQ